MKATSLTFEAIHSLLDTISKVNLKIQELFRKRQLCLGELADIEKGGSRAKRILSVAAVSEASLIAGIRQTIARLDKEMLRLNAYHLELCEQLDDSLIFSEKKEISELVRDAAELTSILNKYRLTDLPSYN
jgi:hypothetical protein